MANSRLCSIPDCGKPVKACGWCQSHYLRNKRHGDPLGGQTFRGAPMAFINDVAVPYTGDDCLAWPFARQRHNGRSGGRGIVNGGLAHRIVCSLAHGAPPSTDHDAAHSCGNGHLGCVNPRHLRWATKKENSNDTLTHGTHNRGERCGKAKLTRSEVLDIRQMLSSGVPTKTVAAKFNINGRTVGRIRDRQRWSWLD